MLAGWTREITHPTGELDHNEVMARFIGYLRPIVTERREGNGSDMISRIARGHVFGRPIAEHEAIGACAHLVMAGLDTVAGLLGFTMLHLATHPQDRLKLSSEGVTHRAVEEFIRRFPLVTIMRLARTDFSLSDVTVRAGDLVALPSSLYNLHEDRYPRALEVDLERKNDVTCTFGNGVHRCPGSNLARAEMRIILEEWMKRIPEFWVAEGTTPKQEAGFVGAVSELQLEW